MAELDYISAELLEGVGHKFACEKLVQAQCKAWEILAEIKGKIELGMTEADARALAIEIFLEHGITKHWHQPYIRFGPGTLLTFHQRLQKDYRLAKSDPFYIDLGPILKNENTKVQYEADVGDTFVFGENLEAEKCAVAARSLFHQAVKFWKTEKPTGLLLYEFLGSRAQECGYDLVEKVEGHRLSDFPHQRFSKENLARLPFNPASSLWVLEVHLVDKQRRFGAFYEDLLG